MDMRVTVRNADGSVHEEFLINNDDLAAIVYKAMSKEESLEKYIANLFHWDAFAHGDPNHGIVDYCETVRNHAIELERILNALWDEEADNRMRAMGGTLQNVDEHKQRWLDAIRKKIGLQEQGSQITAHRALLNTLLREGINAMTKDTNARAMLAQKFGIEEHNPESM